MFTGIIACTGHIAQREECSGDLRLLIDASDLALDDVHIGDSIAVNGCCLTVTALDTHAFAADVSSETLRLTTLGALQVGAVVNLEKAMRLGDRLDGHLVSGHVDGIGTVLAVDPEARSQRFRLEAPQPLARFIAAKGSICVDGVSLTVNAVDGACFEVNLIPHTLEHTSFGQRRPGDLVNIEVDLIARYTDRLGNW